MNEPNYYGYKPIPLEDAPPAHKPVEYVQVATMDDIARIEAKLDDLLALLRPVPEISGSLPLSDGGYGRPPVHDPNGGRR